MKKVGIIVILGLLAVLVFSCNLSAEPENGNLVIHLYSQAIQEAINDPSISIEDWVAANNVELGSLIQVHGLNPEYYMGDEFGRVTISNVPAGNYTIHPVFMGTEHDIVVQVVDGATTSRTIVMPDVVIQGYLVHADFMNAGFRKALSVGLDRDTILTNLDLAHQPAYAALPAIFYQDGLYTSTNIIESAEVAETLFGDEIGQVFVLKHNTSDMHSSLAAELIGQWDAYNAIGTVTPMATEWDSFRVEVYDDHDFDVARVGWKFDSNNPLVFLKKIFDWTDYSSTDFQALVSELEQAQADMDAESFLSYIDEAHSMILDQGLFIPLYEQ